MKHRQSATAVVVVSETEKENIMKSSIKKAVATGAIVTGLALGGTGVVMATTGAAAAPGAVSDSTEQDPSYVGSVTAPQDANEPADGAEGTESAAEAAESAALEPLATVTPEEATTAALAAVPGTAGPAQLENENGYVVYGIEVTGADGTKVDVKVDAGNGSVLAQDTEDATEANDN